MSCRSDDRTPTPCHPPCQDGLYSFQPPLPCWLLLVNTPVELGFIGVLEKWAWVSCRGHVSREGVPLWSWHSAASANPTPLIPRPGFQFSCFIGQNSSLHLHDTFVCSEEGESTENKNEERGLLFSSCQGPQRSEIRWWIRVIALHWCFSLGRP